jgi:hypothetical protein
MGSLGRVRRVAIVAVAVAGIALFGTGVRGLTELDARLAGAVSPAGQEIDTELRRESGQQGDCRWRKHEQRREQLRRL